MSANLSFTAVAKSGAARLRRLAFTLSIIGAVASPTGVRGADDFQLVQVCELQLKDGYDSGTGYSLAFSPDGKSVLMGTGSEVSGVVLLDALTGVEIRRFPSAKFPHVYLFVDYSPDGRHGAFGCLDGQVKLWSISEGQELHSLAHGGVPSSVEFSPDARRLAAAGADGTLCIWDVPGGTEVMRVQANATPLSGVAWSPAGREIVTVGWDRTLRVWDVATATVSRSTPHPEAIWAVEYSPDGRQIATVTGGILEGVAVYEMYALSQDNTVRIWDAATGQALLELKGLAHVSRDIAYSPDGKLLAAASIDKAVHVWDVATGEEVGRLPGKTWTHAVAWSPDGKFLAVAGGVTRGKEPTLFVEGERLRLFRVQRPSTGAVAP